MASRKPPSSGRGPRGSKPSPKSGRPGGGGSSRPPARGARRDDDAGGERPRPRPRGRPDDDRSGQRPPPRGRPAGPRDNDRAGQRPPPRGRPDDGRGERRPPARPNDRAPASGGFASKNDEERLHGLRAVRAAFDKRPKDMRRIWVTEDRKKDIAELLTYCAHRNLPFHITDTDEVTRVSGVQRNEGVCMSAVRPPVPTLDSALEKVKTANASLWVALEDVGDPHNVGAIIRACAHFGVDAVLGIGRTARRNPALLRTSEGGAESVPLVSLETPMDALRSVRRAGFTIVGTSPHASKSIFDIELPRRTLFVLGAERSGLSDAVVGATDELVGIPGSGDVESLNVACAVSVLLGEAWRRRPRGIKPN